MDVLDYLRFVAALGFVLGLIALVAWLARRFRLAGVGAPAGTARRLAVVESLPLDPRRRLVLIRHDDTEHLLLLGADGNRVIEGGLPRARRAPGSPP